MTQSRLIGTLVTLVGLVLIVLSTAKSHGLFDEHSAILAATGAIMAATAIPYVLFDLTAIKDADGRAVSPWYYMLSDPTGGWNLARVQLTIWFFPIFALYTAFSIRDNQLVAMSQSTAILLGLGGATSILSAAMTGPTAPTTAARSSPPGAPTAAPQSPAPDLAEVAAAASSPAQSSDPYLTILQAYHDAATILKSTDADPNTQTKALQSFVAVAPTLLALQSRGTTAATVMAPEAGASSSGEKSAVSALVWPRPNAVDLVTDSTGHGDFSRYQYLLLCLLGAGLSLVHGIGTGTMPDLPNEFLYLIGASQTAYLGTAAIKRWQGPA